MMQHPAASPPALSGHHGCVMVEKQGPVGSTLHTEKPAGQGFHFYQVTSYSTDGKGTSLSATETAATAPDDDMRPISAAPAV